MSVDIVFHIILSISGTIGRIGLGVGVGALVFLVVFLGIGFLEIFLKMRTEVSSISVQKLIIH